MKIIIGVAAGAAGEHPCWCGSWANGYNFIGSDLSNS